jgi:hypothetical protein
MDKEQLKKDIEEMEKKLASMREAFYKPEKVMWNSDDIFIAYNGINNFIMTFSCLLKRKAFTFSSLESTYSRYMDHEDPQELLDYMVDRGYTIKTFSLKEDALRFMLEL